MFPTSGNRRGAIPIEILAMLVVALVILAVVILFFKGGMGEIGKKFGQTSGGVKGQTGTVTTQMGTAVTNIGASYVCDTVRDPHNCANAGGLCTSALDCSSRGWTRETGYETVPGTADGCPTLRICCCERYA